MENATICDLTFGSVVTLLSLVKVNFTFKLNLTRAVQCACVAGEYSGEESEHKSSFLHQQLLVSDGS